MLGHSHRPDPLAAQIDSEWARIQAEKPREPEHHCAKCKTPFGKSAVRCPNEPKGTR